MINRADAIMSLCPNTEWAMLGDVIDWHDTKQTQPTVVSHKYLFQEIEG